MVKTTTTVVETAAGVPPSVNHVSNLLRDNHWTFLVCFFCVSTAAKVLLFPAYRSTDFDVHNHWKALTLHLNSTREWYFDDTHVRTVHTLDYPPSFAFFEYFWSNNYVTRFFMNKLAWLDEACLALKESSSPRMQSNHTVACVAFMRTTVILSELVYWFACYVWAAITPEKSKNQHFSWNMFILLVSNPSILWLDHVHFQYNGFLLGILLLSVACLWKGASHASQDGGFAFHAYHLTAAVLYAMLLTLKHLYITLALWYFCYLLRKYCFVNKADGSSFSSGFSIQRLLVLGLVTVFTLLLPFVPFLSTAQLARIVQRLFPFERGLVHDYWAGNFWALYMAVQKVVRRLPADIPPSFVAFVLLCSLLPGSWSAWKVAAASEKFHSPMNKQTKGDQKEEPIDTTSSQSMILAGLAYSALASFMTAYHVHEKAIVTTLLPLAIFGLTAKESRALLHFRTQALGLTGLLPLLFPPTECAMKSVTLVAYLIFLRWVVESEMTIPPRSSASSPFKNGHLFGPFVTPQFEMTLIILAVVSVVFVLELLPISVFGRFEFIPLAYTSVVVALNLVVSFVELLSIVLWSDA